MAHRSLLESEVASLRRDLARVTAERDDAVESAHAEGRIEVWREVRAIYEPFTGRPPEGNVQEELGRLVDRCRVAEAERNALLAERVTVDAMAVENRIALQAYCDEDTGLRAELANVTAERDEARATAIKIDADLEKSRTRCVEKECEWDGLVVHIAQKLGDDDDRAAADEGGDDFHEQFDPWECVRQAARTMERLVIERDQSRAESVGAEARAIAARGALAVSSTEAECSLQAERDAARAETADGIVARLLLIKERDEARAEYGVAADRLRSLLTELWDGVRIHGLRAPSESREPGEGARLIHAYCGGIVEARAECERVQGEAAAMRRVVEETFTPWNASEAYDVFAEAFYAETGYMAPGKSVPMEMNHGEQWERERGPAWDKWRTARREALIARARAVLVPDAGRSLLDELAAARRVAEAARKVAVITRNGETTVTGLLELGISLAAYDATVTGKAGGR